jgi:hypothetical protein
VVLVAAVGVVTVAVPPLIAPDEGGSGSTATAPTTPATGSATATTPAPTSTSLPTLTSSPGEATRPQCAPVNPSAVAAGLPSCTVYSTALGNGWAIESTGVKVVPAGVVPGTDQVAIRVEPEEKVASVSLVAAVPVTLPAGARLRFRVYGGRVHGTVLRVSVQPGAGKPVVLTAPVDVWSSFAVEVGTQRTVQRIDLVIATDMVPNAYRFFVDDVEFAR